MFGCYFTDLTSLNYSSFSLSDDKILFATLVANLKQGRHSQLLFKREKTNVNYLRFQKSKLKHAWPSGGGGV